jgi:hypothetical protein
MQTRVDHDDRSVAVINPDGALGEERGLVPATGAVPALAVRLPRAEHDLAVLDRMPQLVEAGAGLGLFQNAMPALERLGRRDVVAAGGVRVKASC